MNRASQKRKLTIEQMTQLVKMTQNHDRSEIAEKFGVSKPTVWKYQKLFKLI